MSGRHYEISATVTTYLGDDKPLDDERLRELLMESGDIEEVERIAIRELET